jgi:hypothetical protein
MIGFPYGIVVFPKDAPGYSPGVHSCDRARLRA